MPGSFTGTKLEEILKNNGVDTVVICGCMTQMCCNTTVRQAFHIGYKVGFLSNATGNWMFQIIQAQLVLTALQSNFNYPGDEIQQRLNDEGMDATNTQNI